MHWEAASVIGGSAIIFGVLLYLPAQWWARRSLRESPEGSGAELSVTKSGFVFYGVFVAVLFAGFAMQHIAPSSRFGEFVGSRLGMVIYAGGLAAIGVMAERVLVRLGFVFLRRKDGATDAASD